MDDFTFPATAAAAEPADTVCPHHHHRRHPFPHFSSSPLWFPLDAGLAVTPALAVLSRGPVDDMEEQEPTSSSSAGRRSVDNAERGGGHGEEDDDDEGVDVLRGAGAGEEKMDMLWENFNEELEALQRRAGSCSKAAWGLQELSDTESERGRAGCAPMLRASSRAGGYRRTGGSWVLLMRIFKRLFVVEKTFSAASGRHQRAQ